MEPEDYFKLNGRVALVTGSSQGIGLEIAMWLLKAGASVVFHGSRPSAKLDDAVGKARALGGKAIGIPADIGHSAANTALVQGALKAFGQIDILVQNASVQDYMTVEEFSSEEFAREYNCNLRSTFELVKLLLPGMRERRWGRVVTIGSVNQMRPAPRLAIYSTTKAAMVNLVMNLAREHSGEGVTFNNIAPGVIPTGRNEAALEDEALREKLLGSIPARRFGSVADCAALALLLCSDAGGYITGADIPVTGGMHL
jgi:NAD(P)-dependent dehydrogenase (short-subunit alcohol dehydrogenase family)